VTGGVNTGGGGYVGGSLNVGGDYAGRDSIRIGQVVQVVVNVSAGGGPQAGPADPDAKAELERQIRDVVDTLQGQKQQLDQLGVESGIPAPPAMPAGAARGGMAAGGWSGLGSPAVAGKNIDAGQAARVASGFSGASAQLQQIERQLAAPVVEFAVGDQRLDVVGLLVRQGNLALWRFRQAASRLSGQQSTADFMARLEWPAPPELQAMNAQARGNIQVLRGLALWNMVQPLLSNQPNVTWSASNQLLQGRWSDVLDGLQANGTIDAETAMHARTQLEALGQPYNPGDVNAAAQEAEQAFRQALERDPHSTAAMVNLATLLADWASFGYAATGTADRDRLGSAQTLFGQARQLLASRTDPASLNELGRCRLYMATALPPGANLDAVQAMTMYAQLMQAAHSRAAQQTVQWDTVRRLMARNSPEFVDQAAVAEARELFTRAGDNVLAAQCARMLQNLQTMLANQPGQIQRAQRAWPVVGSWNYQGGNAFVAVAGRIVFDADGIFHWLADAGPMPGMVAERSICLGGYQVMNGAISLQGMRWMMAPPQAWGPVQPSPSIQFGTQFMVRGWTADQLAIYVPENGVQAQLQRV
jgi:hypothetical protein